MCHDFITFNKLDFFILTETWLSQGDCSPLIEATPPDFTHLHQPRLSGRGGGVAVIYRNDFKCTPIYFSNVTAFEHLAFTVNSKVQVLILIIYRPPRPNSAFIQEFSEFLSHFMSKFDKVLILGDFNIHVCCPTQTLARDFIDTLESLNLTQVIHEPTHSKGHTLDLVLHSGLSLTNLETKDICVSDHKAILFCTVLSHFTSSNSTPIRRRVFNSTSAFRFSELFTAASLNTFNPNFNTDELVSLFNDTCQTVLDSVAPYKESTPKSSPQPWFNEYTRELKRDCRRKERKWKKTCLNVFYEIWKDALKTYQKAVKEAKASFLSNLILANHSNPRILFQVLDSVTNPSSSQFSEASQETCEKFSDFFTNKINDIRCQITPPAHVLNVSRDTDNYFSQFELISLSFLSKTISRMKPTMCSLDFIPTKLLKEAIDTVGPSILRIINSSLENGTFPSSFKHAVVQPLLKKPNLDPTVFNYFRPISNFHFYPKF